MTHNQAKDAQTIKVKTLKDAAEMTARKQDVEMGLAHEAYQGMLNRDRTQTEKAEGMAHEAYQNKLDREHKTLHKVVDVAHQGHQAELSRHEKIHQEQRAQQAPKQGQIPVTEEE